MADILLPLRFADLDQVPAAAAYLRHIVERADIVGQDRKGRAIMRFEFAAEPWLLDKLAELGAADENTEEDDPAEDDDPAEEDDPGEEEPDLEDDELDEGIDLQLIHLRDANLSKK